MDPISLCASLLAILAASKQSCSLLFIFFRSILHAPKEVYVQSHLLNGLAHSFASLHELCTGYGDSLRLPKHFEAEVRDCLNDLQLVETKLRALGLMLASGASRRIWARVKWSLSSNDWLTNFFARVEIYHTQFGLQLVSAQVYGPSTMIVSQC